MATDRPETLEHEEQAETLDAPQDEAKESRLVAGLLEIIETLLLGLLIFFLLRSAVQNFRVEGDSMEPSLHDGQHLLINKLVYLNLNNWRFTERLPFIEARPGETRYLFHPPRRGEVVVFRFPQDPQRDFIKRIIGEPGEIVEIREGQVYVNGNLLRETYTKAHRAQEFPPQRVPAGHYFVLGDNRDNSSDSRTWGTVPVQNIVGRAEISYWPREEWGRVPNYTLTPTEESAASVGLLTGLLASVLAGL